MPFYFFFGLLGLAIGALGAWFLLANHPFESLETPGGPVDAAEASYLAERMAAEGMPVDEAVVVRLLELHGAYVDGMAEPEYAPLPEPEPVEAPEPAASKADRAK
jgi:hypothetical protein